MKKTFSLLALLVCLLMQGCSIPATKSYSHLYSFTRQEKPLKLGFGMERKIEVVKDFREIEMYPEDITALKDDVEVYISENPGLDETIKASLRELKVCPGQNKEQVMLLLGEPDKSTNRGQLWIYRINRLRAFTVFIIPVFFAHEGYYLYFQDERLVNIEKHYPRQVIHQASAPGIIQGSGSGSDSEEEEK